MATWADVRRLALALPHAAEHGSGEPSWKVADKLFAWDRPLRRSDLAALGAAAPPGEILAVRVPDLGAKAALLAEGRPFFTTRHFDGYPAVLVVLADLDVAVLAERLEEARLARASKRVAAAYLAGRST